MSEYTKNAQKARGGNKDKASAPKSSKSTRNTQKTREGKGKDKAPAPALRQPVETLRPDLSSVCSVQSVSSISPALAKYMRGQQEARGEKSKIPVPAHKKLQHSASIASIASEWAPILPTTAYTPVSPYDQARPTIQQPQRHDSAVSIRTIGSQAAVLESQVEYLNLQLDLERMSTAKDFEKEREELKVQLTAAQARFEKVNSEADGMDDELHDMHHELNVLHNKSLDQAEEIEILQARVKELESALRECKKCAELQVKLDKLEKTALVSKEQLDDGAKQILQKEHEKRGLERRINELEAQRASAYGAKLVALEKGGKTLREQLRAKEHAEVDIQAKATLLKRENVALKKQVEHLQGQKQKQSNATRPDPSIAIIAALKKNNAELEKRVERAHADGKKRCAELKAATAVKVEALEKEARGLREKLHANEETDANASAEMTRLAMQQIADAQAEVAETKETNATLTQLVNHLEDQLNSSKIDPQLAIIEALEQQNSASILQLAEAVDEMLSLKSIVSHHQQEVERLQKQIDDSERMKDIMEADCLKITNPTTPSVPREPIFSMPVYAAFKPKSALLAFSTLIIVDTLPVKPKSALLAFSVLITVDTLQVKPAKTVSFTTSLALSGVTAIDTEPMESLTSFEVVQPILISVQITPSNPSRWLLMTKMRAAVSSNVPIDIQGPDKKSVQDFQQALYNTAAIYDKNIALVASKQKLLIQQFQEIEGLKKRPACTEKEHQVWNDELQAACQLNELNNLVLKQQGEELWLLKKMREKDAAVTAAHGKTRQVMG